MLKSKQDASGKKNKRAAQLFHLNSLERDTDVLVPSATRD